MSAKLQFLVIHCTATPEGRAISSDNIRQWHLAPIVNADGSLTYLGNKYASKELLPKDKIGDEEINKLIPGRGWTRVGYADMIHLTGAIENLIPYDNDNLVEPWEISNGVAGINSKSRHVVYVGGSSKHGSVPKDTRTTEQRLALANYVRQTIAQHPDILVAGHNQFDPKACPSFDTRAMLKANGIAEKNIYQAQLKYKFV